MNITKNKGITLIALVITIIILLILAGVSISALGGENGLITNTLRAKEETEVSQYKEKIELVRTELLIENRKAPTLEQLQNEFQTNHKSWVSSCEIETVDGREKIILITKEGYTFYITETATEYKGKDKIVDTSDLQREDVISLEIVGTGTNGKIVKITDLSGKDYYELKYQIGSTDGEWLEINSGDTVEVEYGKIIYAKLVYVSESGKEHKISIELENPNVEVKDIDTSNIVRKTEIAFADLFEITWGSDGTGTVEYSVSGNLTFNNTSFNNTEIDNVSSLELGTYNVICKVTSPLNNTVTGEKEVKVTTLANTMVTNASNDSVDAKAIYSEYDLAYFRDLVNGGQHEINSKLMNDIDLSKVCSTTIGSWTPIGNCRPTDTFDNEDCETATTYYAGIFEGNNKKIENIYINQSTLYRQSLFGLVKEGLIKNMTISGDITGGIAVSGFVGRLYTGSQVENCINETSINATTIAGGIVGSNDANIINCKNNAVINAVAEHVGGISGNNRGTVDNCINLGAINGGYIVGGIVGWNDNLIQNCINMGEVVSTSYKEESGNTFGITGGITGINYASVTRCINKAEISGISKHIGGIVGRNLSTVSYCCNTGNIIGEMGVGGIVGNNNGDIAYVYNIAEEIKANSTVRGNAGGIIGYQNTENNSYTTRYAYSNSTIIGSLAVGGVIGNFASGTISNVYNIGTVQATTTTNVGNIYGEIYSTSAITNSGSTTESAMIGWSQQTITNNIGNFVKKTNSLPILNITVNDVTF